MKKNLLHFIISLVFAGMHISSAQAQTLRYCTSLLPGTGDKDTIAIGLQSLADSAIAIRAISFSFVFDTSCTSYDSYVTELESMSRWNTFLSKDSLQKPFSIQYQGQDYNARFFMETPTPTLHS
jgi:hypothetical protein